MDGLGFCECRLRPLCGVRRVDQASLRADMSDVARGGDPCRMRQLHRVADHLCALTGRGGSA